MAGPVIQPKLFQILLRFRSHPVAITGDICKIRQQNRLLFPKVSEVPKAERKQVLRKLPRTRALH